MAEPERASMTQSHSKDIDVGRCLRIAQAKFDIKSADLARGLHTVPQQVVRWRGAKDIRVSTLKQITDFFGIGIDEFLSLEK